RAGQVRGQPLAGPDRADRPVDPAAGLHRGGADLVVDRARDRGCLLRAAGAHRRDHRDEPRDAADLVLGQGDRAPDRDRVRHREPVDGLDVEGGRPRQRPVRRVHRRRGEPAERRDLADDHAGQLGQLRRDLPHPAGPGRGRAGPGARGGLRDPADGEVLLAAAAPVLLALYALPQTSWAARWWWRALTAALAIQVAQGLVMTAAVQVFFSPGWLPGDISSILGQTLITLCLLY